MKQARERKSLLCSKYSASSALVLWKLNTLWLICECPHLGSYSQSGLYIPSLELELDLWKYWKMKIRRDLVRVLSLILWFWLRPFRNYLLHEKAHYLLAGLWPYSLCEWGHTRPSNYSQDTTLLCHVNVLKRDQQKNQPGWPRLHDNPIALWACRRAVTPKTFSFEMVCKLSPQKSKK